MSQSIESILSTPDKAKQEEYNISTDINRGYIALKNTIVGGGNKNTKIAKKEILNKNQITINGEEREKTRAEKRK